ncbi:MAG: integrase core domain-containing protein [Planctomycetaceae bacterium]|nr:integrase core domain-containing protein [Planctomycetaceae bacterium]
MRTNPLPKASPNLSGRCERFIETIKLECWNKFIIFGNRHIDHLLLEFTEYYNHHHSHMSRDYLPPVRVEPDEVAKLSIKQGQYLFGRGLPAKSSDLGILGGTHTHLQ